MTAAAYGLVSLLLSSTARAEYPEKQLYIGLHGGGALVLRDWDLGEGVYEDGLRPDKGFGPLAGLRLGYQLKPRLALELGGSWQPVDTSKGGSATTIVSDLDLLDHLTAGRTAPYVVVGVGGTHLLEGDLGADFDPDFQVGLGQRALVSDGIALRLEARDVVSDGFDKLGSHGIQVRAGIDLFPAGLAGKDTDGDGIKDKKDQCVDVPGVETALGCSDADGDGVKDETDRCPAVVGPAELQGCPDGDGDGVVDIDDQCPTEAGLATLAGCPDADGDGIRDGDDACPQEAGVASAKGCPDKDGDTVTDASDACPDEPGRVSAGGCPDVDNDRVPDKDDMCPKVAGVKEANGCLPKDLAKFTGSIKGINFDSGSATIKKDSFKVLDSAAATLKKFSELRLRIEGHTDDQGDDEANMKLSQARAEAVRAYLVSKGVDESRLIAQDFGETRPVANNKTSSGRAANRRIEFVIAGE